MNKRPPKTPGGGKALVRAVKLLFSFYPVLVPVCIFCILFSAVTAALPDVFIQKVVAAIEAWSPTGDWNGAAKEILPMMIFLGGMYLLALIANLVQTQLMAFVTQGYLSKMRCKLFNAMQDLPIRYFDSTSTATL